MDRKDCIWGQSAVLWKDAGWWWSVCQLAVIQPPGVDATTAIQPWLIEPWSPYKSFDSGSLDERNKLIRLICRIYGYNYDETKEVRNIQINVKSVNLIIDPSLNVELDTKEYKLETENVL